MAANTKIKIGWDKAYLGKNTSDLIEGDMQILEDGSVVGGTFKYVSDWEEAYGENGHGYFLPFTIIDTSGDELVLESDGVTKYTGKVDKENAFQVSLDEYPTTFKKLTVKIDGSEIAKADSFTKTTFDKVEEKRKEEEQKEFEEFELEEIRYLHE